MIQKEIRVFFAAILFYTRIPVPANANFSNELLNKSTRYFPLIGIIVGGIGAAIFWLVNLILPFQVAIILSMISTIIITGAFHEDGFADFCDGFGGGLTRERILEIMKDSRIGTYGAAGLLFILLTKYLCLFNIQEIKIPLILISGHAFSRMLPVCVIYTSIYVREDLLSKAKPIGHKSSAFSFWIALVFASAFLIFIPWKALLIILVLSLCLFLLFRRYIQHKIGGYTGDVLGALQQLSELTFYIGFLIYQHNLA